MSTVTRFPIFQSHVADGEKIEPNMADAQFCVLHDKTIEAIESGGTVLSEVGVHVAKISTEVGWIKITGYAALTGFLAFGVLVWGVFHPMVENLRGAAESNRIAIVELRKLSESLIETDKESKQDRRDLHLEYKELHQAIEELRRTGRK